MKISYRGRRRFRRFIKGCCIFVLAFLLIYGIWVLWGQRFILYTREGAVLDFNLPALEPGQVAEQPQASAPVAIEERPPETMEQESSTTTLPKILGYYIDAQQLAEDPAAVGDAVAKLPEGTAVMLDLKSKFGYFFYSTKVSGGATSDSMDISAMDHLLAALSRSNLYLIARLPALRDRAFGLENPSAGLAVASGALWEDPDACYWLNPGNEDTLSYLKNIVGELQVLGFDEVVFTDFQLPETERIVYDETVSKDTLIADAAASLVKQCARGNFVLSFQSEDPKFPLPEGQSRLYLTGVEATQAAQMAQTMGVADPTAHLVFLTESNDTRYEEYGVLRPLSGA